MKILIYGAGVIGRVYASRFHEVGFNITLLARGKHYEKLKEDGIILKNILTRKQTTWNVPLIQELKIDDFYDLIIVTVRLDQIDAILPVLKGNISPLVMPMFNNPSNINKLTLELSKKHIIFGFPGVGGAYKDNGVDYIQIGQQKTTIGEINGEYSIYIKKVRAHFERAGFKVEISNNMQAWLKTHAIFVSCIAAAIIKENGDSVQLGNNRRSVELMVRSIREGFSACKALGMPIAPVNLKLIFMTMPFWFSVLYWRHALKGKIGTLAMAPHANAAKDEMSLLGKIVRSMVHLSPLPTPTLDDLLS